MTVALRSPEVAVPGTALAQDDVCDVFAAQPGPGRPGTRPVPAALNASGTGRRHTVPGEWGRAETGGDPVPAVGDLAAAGDVPEALTAGSGAGR